ncbi:hypothetical protein ARC20_03110 [Stenotrophomonas panacihumi]|uniref:Lipoprotein n=1 Tax=Stenotrophomonas panacihumi TaxID=676599 RepID=A0A0R0AQC2_9GAMM|nr:hypothetical protein [Stenotrophomonas panacihumi]KRG47333.1 hypothetical protein ARC20_03110 [Stenotrophomonas panacihumi]PTN55810.1 hypothetical protein C9J98_04350 [Stenotrophomonas panacihumi]
MRSFALLIIAAALAGCFTTRSPSQQIHSYHSAHSADLVRACIAERFTPRYYGGVEVQGGWPKAPLGIQIDSDAGGSRVTTRGPLDPQLASCL